MPSLIKSNNFYNKLLNRAFQDLQQLTEGTIRPLIKLSHVKQTKWEYISIEWYSDNKYKQKIKAKQKDLFSDFISSPSIFYCNSCITEVVSYAKNKNNPLYCKIELQDNKNKTKIIKGSYRYYCKQYSNRKNTSLSNKRLSLLWIFIIILLICLWIYINYYNQDTIIKPKYTDYQPTNEETTYHKLLRACSSVQMEEYDYFAAVIGIHPNWSTSELKKAFHSWMKKNHPDKNPNISNDLVQLITSGYEKFGNFCEKK